MRLPQLPLAAKYRLLFGCAVLLIIAAALAVPWYFLEFLLTDAPFREAERAALDHLHLSMGHAGGPPPAPHGVAPDDASPQPRYVRLSFAANDQDALPQLAADKLDSPSQLDFARRALRSFIVHRERQHAFEQVMERDGLHFQYARPVRITRGCLACHAQGSSATPFAENQLAGMILVDVPAARSAAALLRNRMLLIGAGALAGILAILVFYIIVQRFILAPIQQLRSVAAKVAGGDLSARADVGSGDEFEQLAKSLNDMLERLRGSQEELREKNQLLDEQLTQLAESNVGLYEANRIKSDFLASVSHELRTPLTSIIGFAELLREGAANPDPQRLSRYSENILLSSRILLEIINDLLDLAKIEAGKVDLNVAPTDVASLVRTLTELARGNAGAKQISLECQAPSEPVMLDTDAGKLRQVLYNLLSNAIKFTPAGGEVSIRVVPESDGRVFCAVQDSGPGISPENQERIFEKFRQLENPETRTQGGAGLGLAIARELTGLLGGQIGVQSALGQGSTFWVRVGSTKGGAVLRPRLSLT
ncbi:MAG: ATP-binding protein [Phycisphaerae bacterium]|nr:ATP-binding protein [Phycisphaerae bacterium]